MKYRLNYSYSTVNYHVYIVTSRDPNKHGRKVYIPRDITYYNPLVETDIIFSEPGLPGDGKKRVKARERNENIPIFAEDSF